MRRVVALFAVSSFRWRFFAAPASASSRPDPVTEQFTLYEHLSHLVYPPSMTPRAETRSTRLSPYPATMDN